MRLDIRFALGLSEFKALLKAGKVSELRLYKDTIEGEVLDREALTSLLVGMANGVGAGLLMRTSQIPASMP